MSVGCGKGEQNPSLYRASTDKPVRDVPVPPANGPRLGALANITPVRESPSVDARVLGYLHAGGQVARAQQPYTREGCEQGWYPVRPRGFVCVGGNATTDLEHPTMAAMSIRPKLDGPLPYAFARTTRSASFFERDPERADGVKEVLAVPRSSGLAVVGSWSAFDTEGKRLRLGMTTRGQFIEAEALKAAEPSAFAGVELDGKAHELPVGFVVRRGVCFWSLGDRGSVKKGKELGYHEIVPLTGKYRTIGDVRYWATGEERWVRHDEVTVVQKRNVYPDFAGDTRKWIDVSVITGTAVLYEGKRPVFATLVSAGRDRLGDPKASASTAQGTFQVTGKHVTSADHDPSGFAEGVLLYDVPWIVELSSGQVLHGSFSHDRFGIEHGPGNVQLSPSDARRIWMWVDPELPEGWHGVLGAPAEPTLVLVRK